MSNAIPTRALLLGMGWFPDQPGGLNRYVRELLEALRAEAVDARAVVVGPAANRPPGVTVASKGGAALPARAFTFARAVAAQPATDVVDVHFALYALAPLLLGALRGRPLVVHFHGPWAAEAVAAGDGSELRRRLRQAVERRIYTRADELVTLSHAFARLLVEEYNVAPWRISVVPPGIDLGRFSPGDRATARKRLDIRSSGPLVVAVRRLSPRMGLDVLLDAWARLDGERTLVLAGDGPLRERLERQAHALGIASTVRFLGRVEDDVLVDCYRAADVCVLPTLELEGFGLTALEALACGTPAVGTDAGGLPEVLMPLDPRLIVPAGDVTALATRLAELGDLPSQAECRRRAEEFSWPTAARRNLDIYELARAARGRCRLRVVYLDHTALLSGGELALLRLIPALDVDAHVILGEDGPLAERLRNAGVSVEVLPLDPTVRSLGRHASDERKVLAGLAAIPYVLRLAARLRRLQPDLVHTNSLKSALYGGAAGRLARVPVIWHVRDRIASDYLSERNVRAVRAAARRLPTAVIANSAETLSTLGPLGMPSAVIPSPVPAWEVPPRRTAGPLCFGIVGRIARWKGQHVFLDAFAAAFPAGDERAVVVGAPLFGGDDKRYMDELRKRIEWHGFGDRVEFTGFREDVSTELARLDVLVHASTTPEPFGQVVVEGMAACLPVVAARAGGPTEVIEDGVDGLLYTPGDVSALADAMRRLACDSALRERLGTRARQRAQEFEPQQIARKTSDLYERLVGRVPSSSSAASTGQSNR